jgi:hypothetical protein
MAMFAPLENHSGGLRDFQREFRSNRHIGEPSNAVRSEMFAHHKSIIPAAETMTIKNCKNLLVGFTDDERPNCERDKAAARPARTSGAAWVRPICTVRQSIHSR